MITMQDMQALQARIDQGTAALNLEFRELESHALRLDETRSAFDLQPPPSWERLFEKRVDATNAIERMGTAVAAVYQSDIGAGLDALQARYEAEGASFDTAHGAQQQRLGSAEERLLAYQESLRGSRDKLKGIGEAIRLDVDGVSQSLAAQEPRLDGEHARWLGALRDTLVPAVDKAYADVIEVLDRHAHDALPALLDGSLSQLGKGHALLGAAVESGGASLKGELQTVLRDSMKKAVEDFEQHIEAEFRDLIDRVIVELAERLIETGVLAGAGASATAALTPLLPELAALAKATAAIKEAIHVFKSVVDWFD